MREIIFLSEAKNKSAIDHGGTKRQGGACTVRVSPKAYDPTISTGTYTPEQQLLYKEYQKAKKNGFVGSFAEYLNSPDEGEKKEKPKKTQEQIEAEIKAYSKKMAAKRKAAKKK